MKILTIAYSLPPSLTPQAIQIGRLLYNLPSGHELFVVTADDRTCRIDKDFYGDIREKFRETILLKFKRGIFKKIATRAAPFFFAMPDIFLYWHIGAYKKIAARWGGLKFDAIVTFSSPFSSSLLGIFLKRRFKAKWIAFFSDPWAGNPHFGYKGLAKKINLYFEEKVLRQADRIVFASPEMKGMYLKKYPFLEGKCFFIEHSCDLALYPAKESASGNQRPIFRYIGGIYKTRNAEPVLTAMKNMLDKKMLEEEAILFEIVGDMPPKYRKYHEDLIRRYGVGSMAKIVGGVPYLKSLELMRGADALVLTDAPIEGSVYLPSKLADYIGSGKPIFAITPKDGASARVINNIGGWLAEPDDIPDIMAKLSDIIARHKNGTLEKFKPRQDAKKDFAIDRNVKKFMDILNGEDVIY